MFSKDQKAKGKTRQQGDEAYGDPKYASLTLMDPKCEEDFPSIQQENHHPKAMSRSKCHYNRRQARLPEDGRALGWVARIMATF